MSHEGSLVETKSNQLGTGKVKEIIDGKAIVEYFISIAQRVERTIPLHDLEAVKLAPQTRCYVRDEGGIWQIGRIFQFDGAQRGYLIDFPHGKSVFTPEIDIYVRCSLPVEDPTEILAMKGHETPYFHNWRSRFIRCLMEQREVCAGMTGLLSANIELFPHQVELLRQVLADPVQRYLLADEVGLGKTIEAGVILRQFMGDNPEKKALIIVPSNLASQWRNELENKFYLSEFEERVKILDREHWQELSSNKEKFELIIIDNARQIAAMASSTNSQEKQCFSCLKKLAHQAESLLLLSSLPIINHEREFLVMFHLLEPDNYQLNSLDNFRSQVNQTQEIGRVFLGFNSQAGTEVVAQKIAQFKQLLPTDRYLQNLLAQLQQELEGNGDPAKEALNSIATEVAAIRSHLRNHYCLHPRLVRNPRSNAGAVFPPRNLVPKAEYDLDERAESISALVERWRTQATNQPEYRRIFLLLFRASNTWLGILEQLIDTRLKGISSPEIIQEWGRENSNLLVKTPKFEGEGNILRSLRQIIQTPSEDGDRVELLEIVILYHLSDIFGLQSYRSNLATLKEFIRQRIANPYSSDRLPKLIVFTGFQQAASRLTEVLENTFGSQSVASYQLGQSEAKQQENLARFAGDARCFILIGDRNLTTGLNLQFVEGIIHFDLPWHPHELERRLANLDRLGGKINPLSWLLVGTPDTPAESWYQILRDGFQVFNQSLASYCSYLEKKMPALEEILFDSNFENPEQISALIAHEIEGQKIKIKEQYALDDIEVESDSAREFFNKLNSYDAAHQKMRRNVEGLICSGFQFRQKQDLNRRDVVHYSYSTRTGKPTLIPVDQLIKYFAPAIEKEGTYSRQIANKYPQINFYRLGGKFLDNLAEYVRWDDRGKAFAIWREDAVGSEIEGEEWVGFRFDFIVEIDLSEVKESGSQLDERTLKRRGNALFEPFFQTIFIDVNYQPVEDENLLAILQKSYAPKNRRGTDYNLAKARLSILDRLIPPELWQVKCREARSHAEILLRRSDNFHHKYKLAIDKARVKAGDDLDRAFLAGIAQPKIYPDSVGFMVVAGGEPL